MPWRDWRGITGCSPDALGAGRRCSRTCLHLLRERKLARSSVNQYSCAFRFFYGSVLGRDGAAFQIPLAAAPQRLPEILSREELARLFAAAAHVKARTFLMTAYGTGLRLSELCHLRVEHIDSAADRRCIRVVQGKGAKDRYVPLSDEVLQLLRAWGAARTPKSGCSRRARALAAARREDRAALVPRGVRARGHHQARRHPHAATRLRDAPARSRLRPVQPAAVARPPPGQHHPRYLHLTRPEVPEGAKRAPLSLLAALPPLAPSLRVPH